MNKLTHLKSLPVTRNSDHVYTLYGRLLPGVTTIEGAWGDKGGLQQWYANMAASKAFKVALQEMGTDFLPNLVKELDKLPRMTTPAARKLDETFPGWKLARTEANRSSRQAADFGTAAHKWIEEHINGLNPAMPTQKEVLNAVELFLEFEKKHRIEWLATELLVVSEKHLFAGTLDSYAIVNGKRTLIDFKTSNSIGENYILQTAGYQIALEEMGEIPEQRVILRIPRTGSTFEAVIVNTDAEFDKEVFLHLLEAHRWKVYIDNRHRDQYKNLKLKKLI